MRGSVLAVWGAVVGGILIVGLVPSLIEVERPATISGVPIPFGTSINDRQYRSIHVGDSKASVRDRFGLPAGKAARDADCVGYPSIEKPGAAYVVCFEDGRVTKTSTL